MTSRDNGTNERNTELLVRVMEKRVLSGQPGCRLCFTERGAVGLHSEVELLNDTLCRALVVLQILDRCWTEEFSKILEASVCGGIVISYSVYVRVQTYNSRFSMKNNWRMTNVVLFGLKRSIVVISAHEPGVSNR